MTDDGNGADRDEPPSTAETVVLGVSVVFTLALFAYVTWQATAATAAPPRADVAGTRTLPGGDVQVTVALRNPGGRGLVSAEVEVGCTTPPASITFEHVPVRDRRVGHVVCPPGTTDPNATVSTWIDA